MTTATVKPTTTSERVGVPEDAFARRNGPIAARPVRLGPLLVVCGLAGGAGVTTLSYLIARTAAQQWPHPVLVADTGGPSGGLAACAGVEVPRSLDELAQQLATGVALGSGIYATGRDGLRVLATGPEFSSPQADESIDLLLAHAREAHGLTVIDCGTLARGIEQTAAAVATHVAWVLTATPHAVQSAQRVLEAAPAMAGKELIIARNDMRQSTVRMRELRRLAAERQASLVLMPHLTRLDAGGVEACAEEAQVPVQAILGALRR